MKARVEKVTSWAGLSLAPTARHPKGDKNHEKYNNQGDRIKSQMDSGPV